MPAIEPIYPRLGRRLREARKRLVPSLSQEEMAERVGLPRSAISAIEGGRQRILTHTFARLCDILDVKPNDLLENIDSDFVHLDTVQSDEKMNRASMSKITDLIEQAKRNLGP